MLGHQSGIVNPAEYFPDGSQAHCQVYIQLHTAIHAHMRLGVAPELQECQKPTGAIGWLQKRDTSCVGGIELYADGIDEHYDDEVQGLMKVE